MQKLKMLPGLALIGLALWYYWPPHTTDDGLGILGWSCAALLLTIVLYFGKKK